MPAESVRSMRGEIFKPSDLSPTDVTKFVTALLILMSDTEAAELN